MHFTTLHALNVNTCRLKLASADQHSKDAGCGDLKIPVSFCTTNTLTNVHKGPCLPECVNDSIK